MKQYKVFLTLLIILFQSYMHAQSISLPSQWLFKMADDPKYSEINFEDTNWEKQNIPGNWESQGYPEYNGIAWYRIHFEVDKKYLGKELYLLLGKIDDADETYLNGTLIASSGKFPPESITAWNDQRIYEIPKEILKEKNVLAIRVYDGQGGGGVHSGIVGIYGKSKFMKANNPGPAPKKSFYQITTANGLIAAVYNERLNAVESVSPHIFQMYDLGKSVRPFVKNLFLETDSQPLATSHYLNTHIVKVGYQDFSVYYFAPFSMNEKVFVAMIEGGKEKIKNLDFTFYADYGELLTKNILVDVDSKKSQKFFLFSFNDSLHNNSLAIEQFGSETTLKNLLNNEVDYMHDIFKHAFIPTTLTADEKSLYEQSISILKMGQVSQKEVFPKSRGQILASLPPGNWNIGWLRDATYAIMALSKLGLYDEAKNALNFFLNADAGYYKNFVWNGVDHGVKVDYKLSVCRYFGIGKEESDFNENGPNMELDGFGLFLTAFSDYINKSGDKNFLKENYETLTKLIADPIITFIEPGNLIRTESGPWEQHLPGRKQAFTSIVNSAGLREFAELLRNNNYQDYQKYFDASDKLKNGIEQNLFYEQKLIKGFWEAESPATKDFYDGGTIEAFTQKVFTDKNFFDKHFAEYEKILRIDKRRGFSRLNNPDWYTISEWPFLDFRIAIALNNFNRRDEAKCLIDSVTDYAKMNFNYIAELYNYEDENYGGAIPMIGYGAGAYILAITDYYKQ